METYYAKFIKAKDYFLKRIAQYDDPETVLTDMQMAMNDAANLFAESMEEYQKIYDMLNNMAFTIIC